MIKYSTFYYEWESIKDDSLSESESLSITVRLDKILNEWIGSKYMAGQSEKGVVSDCVGFLCGVFDELFREKRSKKLWRIPRDACFHYTGSCKARKSAETIEKLYSPTIQITDRKVQPGDVLVVGPPRGGPGHAMIVGPEKNTLWHVNTWAVSKTGFIYPAKYTHVFKIFRCVDRKLWA